jgi:hypothetical protein
MFSLEDGETIYMAYCGKGKGQIVSAHVTKA